MATEKGITLTADQLRALKITGIVLSAIGTVAGAYHGYARNKSVGWALGWAMLGGAFPFVTVPVAFAQGFGERKRLTR